MMSEGIGYKVKGSIKPDVHPVRGGWVADIRPEQFLLVKRYRFSSGIIPQGGIGNED